MSNKTPTDAPGSSSEIHNQTTPIKEYEEKIPTKAKVAYGFANAGNGMLSGLGLGTINLFYLKTTGLDPGLMALSWIIFAVWNAINDPLLGIIEDRTKSKLGRRVPFLRYGAVFYTLSFIIIWYPTTAQNLLFWNHLLMLFIFDTLYSMIGLITYSLPAEMALTAKERSNIMLYSTAIGAIGIAVPLILPIIYLGGTPNIAGFKIAMIIIGILGGTVIWLSSYYIKENRYAAFEESYGLIDSIKETMKNKPFLVLEIGIFAMSIATNILTGYLLFITDYVLDFNFGNPWNIVILGVVIVLGVLSIRQIMLWIGKKGVKQTFIFGSTFGIYGFALLLIIGLILKPTAANKIPLVIGFLPLSLLLFGLFTNMFASQPLMADAIDNDEILTGKRRETSYSGVNALITKPAISIGHAFFLWIIKYYGYNNTPNPDTGTVPGPLEQPAGVTMGVIIAYTIIPIICILISIISMRYFQLDGPEWVKQKRRLQEIHVQKEKDFIAKLQATQQAEQPTAQKPDKK